MVSGVPGDVDNKRSFLPSSLPAGYHGAGKMDRRVREHRVGRFREPLRRESSDLPFGMRVNQNLRSARGVVYGGTAAKAERPGSIPGPPFIRPLRIKKCPTTNRGICPRN